MNFQESALRSGFSLSDRTERRKAQRRQYSQTYRTKHPERARKTRYEVARKRRLEVIAMLGGCCANCGIADEEVLTLNHKIPLNRAKNGLRRVPTWAWWLKAKKDPSNVELLCANCHLKETKRQYRENLLYHPSKAPLNDRPDREHTTTSDPFQIKSFVFGDSRA